MSPERIESANNPVENKGEAPRIEVVPVVGGQGRKISEEVLEENRQYLKGVQEKKEKEAEREGRREERLKKAEAIGAKIKGGELPSQQELSEVKWGEATKIEAKRAAQARPEEETVPPFKVVDRRRSFTAPKSNKPEVLEEETSLEPDSTTEGERRKRLEGWLVGVLASRLPDGAAIEGLVVTESARDGGVERSDGMKEVMDDLEQAPEAVREQIGAGFWSLGHHLEEKKNRMWAWVTEKAGTQLDSKSASGRFTAALAGSLRDDALEARKKIEDMRERRTQGKGTRLMRHKLGGMGYLVGGITKYGRMIADLPGVNLFAFAPMRYAMMGGALVGRLAGAAKEARLTGEEALERTRGAKGPEGINLAKGLEIAEGQTWEDLELDPEYKSTVDGAWDEALNVYADAQKKAGEKKVSRGDLEKAYQQNIPQQVLERLKRQSTKTGIVAGLPRRTAQWVAERSITSVANSIEAIEQNTALTVEEKEAAKEEVAAAYRKRLRDLDRMVDHYGAVDGLAAAAKSGEFLGKAAVAAMSVETLYAGIDHLWSHGMPQFFTTAARHAKDLFSGTILTPTTLGAGDLSDASASAAPGIRTEMSEEIKIQRAGEIAPEAKGATGAAAGAAATAPEAIPGESAKGAPKEAAKAVWERVAGKKDSPLSLAKQVYMERAQQLGYAGDLNDAGALKHWAETQSTRHIVGQFIRENQSAYEDLIGKIGKPPTGPQEMDGWLKKVPVKTFNGILHDKVSNLIHPGDVVRVGENADITALSPDGKTVRMGHITESAPARGAAPAEESIFKPKRGHVYDPASDQNSPRLDTEGPLSQQPLEQHVGVPSAEELGQVGRALNLDLAGMEDKDLVFEVVRDYQLFTQGTLFDKEAVLEKLNVDIGNLQQIGDPAARNEATIKWRVARSLTERVEGSYKQYFKLIGQYGLDEVKVEELQGLGRGVSRKTLEMLSDAQEIEGVGVSIGGNMGVFRSKYDADQFEEYLRRLFKKTPLLAGKSLEEVLKRQVR